MILQTTCVDYQAVMSITNKYTINHEPVICSKKIKIIKKVFANELL